MRCKGCSRSDDIQRLLSYGSATGAVATADRAAYRPLGTLDRGLRHAGMSLLPRTLGEALISFPLFAMANTPSTAKRPAETQDATSPAQPVATVRYGDVSAAVFAEVIRLPNGTEVTTHRVSLRRSYRDQQANEWKHTHVLGDSETRPRNAEEVPHWHLRNPLQTKDLHMRRARDSNPQRLAPHLISSQAANHSRTLRARTHSLESLPPSDKPAPARRSGKFSWRWL